MQDEIKIIRQVLLLLQQVGVNKVDEQLTEKMDKLWQVASEEVAIAMEQGEVKGPEQTSRIGLAKWFSQAIERANEAIDQAEDKVGLKCVCGKGCDACCRQAIQVLPTEAKAISAVIDRFSPEEKKKLKEKIDHWLAAIKASGLDTDQNKYYQKGADIGKLYAFMDAYFKLDLPCPMLSEEGACMIYEVRPGGCWSYRVYSSSKECEESFEAAGGMKHDEWERSLLDHLFQVVKPDHTMKLLPYYIDDILNHRL